MKGYTKVWVIVIGILFFIFMEQEKVNAVKQMQVGAKNRKCYQTNETGQIQLSFGHIKVEQGKDLIIEINSDQSLKDRKVSIMENGYTVYNGDHYIGYKDGENYCYRIYFSQYEGNTLEDITISNIGKGVSFYVTAKYSVSEVTITKVTDGKSHALKEVTKEELVPQFKSYYTKEQLKTLKEQDETQMKQKWAEALDISVDQVENYLDQYNAKTLGKLHKEGQVIKNAKGETIQLNGTCLFHLEDYGDMYHEDTFKALKYWGINCIRIPAYLCFQTSSKIDRATITERGLDTAYEEKIAIMDRLIEEATRQGLYCMIDFHILGQHGDISNWLTLAKKFYTHFCEKYAKQENIIYEIANEPFATSTQNLVEYTKQMRDLIKKYDPNPVIIVGSNAGFEITETVSFYEACQEQKIDDVFISMHYYDGREIQRVKNRYDITDIPLVFTEWSNSTVAGSLDYSDTETYPEMTKKYLRWWDQERICNMSFMLCDGDYPFALWNKDLTMEQRELLKYGFMTEPYLSDYGKFIFQSYFESMIKNIKKELRIQVNLTASNENPKIGEKVRFTANVVGSKENKQYKFIIHNKKTAEWSVLRDYSNQATFDWSPSTEAVREVFVDIKEEGKEDFVIRSNRVELYTASKIELDQAKLTFSEKTEQILNAMIENSVVDYREVTFSSSNEKVARVNERGIVTPIGNGACQISVTKKQTKLKAICDVEVNSGESLVVTIKASKINPKVKEKVDIVVNTTGNIGVPMYKFIIHNKDTNEWAVLQDYSQKDCITWYPINETNRDIYVDVKDDKHSKPIRSKALEVQRTQKIVDIILFTGQSNMVGCATTSYSSNIEENSAFEVKFNSNIDREKGHLYDFCRQRRQNDLGNNVYQGSTLVLEKQGSATLVPAFLQEYINQTGHKVIFAHAARGGQEIQFFTQTAMSYLIDKVNATMEIAQTYAKENGYQIGKKFYVIYQGESDAAKKTSKEDYKARYKKFHQMLLDKTGLEFGSIITPGYWNAQNSSYNAASLDTIVEADQELAQENKDIYVVTKNVTTIYSKDQKYLNKDLLHLNAIGLRMIGDDAAKGLLSQMKDLVIDVKVSNHYPLVHENIKIRAITTGELDNKSYKFILHDRKNDKWTLLQDYSDKNEIDLKLESSHVVEIFVDVKNEITKEVKRSQKVVISSYQKGDFDKNDQIDVTDAYQVLTSISKNKVFTEEQYLVIDMNEDKKIDITDAYLLLKEMAKI